MKLFQQSFATSKKLCETFKVQHNEVVEAVEKLREHYGQSLSEIKQLKKQLVRYQIPSWISLFKTVNQVPCFYKELDDVSNDELKAIIAELEKTKPGLYLLINKTTDRFGFSAYVAKEVSSKVNLKALSAFLKDTYDIKGGGSAQQIQGGGTSVPANFELKLFEWLTGNIL